MAPTYDKLESRDSSQSEDLETLLPESETQSTDNLKRYSKPSRWQRFGCIIAVFVSFFASMLFGVWLGRGYLSSSTKSCTSLVQNYGPVLQDVDLKFSPQLFDGRLLEENEFRLPGGPESPVDRAWESLGVDFRPIAVPVDQAMKAGIPTSHVKINAKYGGGYIANVEGLHHLHCLNLVRKSLWFNYDYYHSQKTGAFINNDTIVHYHVTHCLDIIRQQLMCTTDVGVLGQVWWDREQPHAYTDFNTRHTCRNFEDVREWARKHQLPEHVEDDFMQPPEVDGDFVYETMP